jgi:hypothetical protein
MSFKSIWGFDPEEAFNAQRASLRELAATKALTASRKNVPRRSHRMFTLKLSSCSECITDEMSPNALKDDDNLWGRLAEILREIGPSDEELGTIRKSIVAQVNRVQRSHCPQGGSESSEH